MYQKVQRMYRDHTFQRSKQKYILNQKTIEYPDNKIQHMKRLSDESKI